MSVVKYSLLVGLQKAGIGSIKQLLVWVLGILVAYPQLLLNLLGKWKEMTLGAVVVYLLNVLLNWLKNKDLK